MTAGGVGKHALMISLTRLAGLYRERTMNGLSPAGRPYRCVAIRAIEAERPRWPLMLIHPVGGSAMAYVELARHLAASQPVYAIENQVMEVADPGGQTIERFAATYLEELGGIGADMPWFLGGYSMGGLVAFEMARQLEAAGTATPAVLIIDTPARVRAAESGEDGTSTRELLMIGKMMALRQRKEFSFPSSLLERADPADRLKVFVQAMRRQGVLPPQIDDACLGAMLSVVRANERAQRAYVPGPYRGRLTLLRAREPSEELREEAGDIYDDPTFGWQAHCAREVSVRQVAGEHLQIIHEPYNKGLAASLQRVMDESMEGGEG